MWYVHLVSLPLMQTENPSSYYRPCKTEFKLDHLQFLGVIGCMSPLFSSWGAWPEQNDFVWYIPRMATLAHFLCWWFVARTYAQINRYADARLYVWLCVTYVCGNLFFWRSSFYGDLFSLMVTVTEYTTTSHTLSRNEINYTVTSNSSHIATSSSLRPWVLKSSPNY
jgi:hypothetical protein